MVYKILRKENINPLLSELKSNYSVYLPSAQHGSTCFAGDESTFAAANGNTRLSTKEMTFPQTELLLRYEYKKDLEDPFKPTSIEVDTNLEYETRLIFGARPCDVKAVKLFDNLYSGGEFKDPYFNKRKENAIFVTIGCTNPLSTCFCTSVGCGPFDETYSDIILVSLDDDGNSFLAKSLSPAGEEILSMNQFATADEKNIARSEEIAKKTESAIERIELSGIKEKLLANFEDTIWEDLSSACLNCGICTYLCPTCHCFNITDDRFGLAGERTRSWDACMFPLFTLEASGHNPRDTRDKRFKNRFNHKFSYYPRNFNEYLCTGCGRCIAACPVGIDIRDVLKRNMDR
ncbi:MAG: 4Fe-4S dicluster domain-containing protein [Actinobacteria bacterium]|nr:4Fe-4S dicluster domain-containing protein [Actinomycetota bacterium]